MDSLYCICWIGLLTGLSGIFCACDYISYMVSIINNNNHSVSIIVNNLKKHDVNKQ